MAHFAKINPNNIVTKFIVAEIDFFDSFIDTEAGKWIQTSYNKKGGIHYNPDTNEPSVDQSKALRKNFAAIGYTYNEQLDAFIPPKPYNSWTLNEQTCLWEPPTPYPQSNQNGEIWIWDENTISWISN